MDDNGALGMPSAAHRPPPLLPLLHCTLPAHLCWQHASTTFSLLGQHGLLRYTAPRQGAWGHGLRPATAPLRGGASRALGRRFSSSVTDSLERAADRHDDNTGSFAQLGDRSFGGWLAPAGFTVLDVVCSRQQLMKWDQSSSIKCSVNKQ